MRCCVVLGRFASMMGGVRRVTLRRVGLMASLLVLSCFVVLGRFLMMARSALVVLCSLLVVVCALMTGHVVASD